MDKLAIYESLIELTRYIRFGRRLILVEEPDTTFTGKDAISKVRPMTRISLTQKGSIILGKNTLLKPGMKIAVKEGTLSIGDNTFINQNSQIFCMNKITIGRNCAIGEDVIIRDHDGHGKQEKTVIIHDHVWISARAIILKGAEIGKDSVVGAGAVVTGKKYPPRSLIVGNPAVVVRKNIDDWV